MAGGKLFYQKIMTVNDMANNDMANYVLYLCYFGLREPLVQTQVLPYLREISKMETLNVSLLTFEPNLEEKWTAEEIKKEKQNLAADNISWHYLKYHKSPSAPATLYDVLNGVRFTINLSRRQKIDILHARAHIPMLMAMLASKVIKSKIIFDIRGLMAEEYADSGVWRENSKVFRFVKRIERSGIKRASQIVVLTNRMRDYLIENYSKKSEDIEVIPCCVDLARIEKATDAGEKNKRFELIYAGSVTGLYLLKEMGNFFLTLKKHQPDAFFRVLTASPPHFVVETFSKLGIGEEDYAVAKVSPNIVPKYLNQAALGISFRTPTFSQIAASPTKIPEYLACGLPVVSNYGVGDTDQLLENEKVGVCLKGFDQEKIEKAVTDILEVLNEKGIKERCINTAHRYFDLGEIGRKRYQNVYRRLIEGKA